MQSPEEHDVGRAALRQIESIIPRAWPFRRQPEEDYGIDAEGEVFDDGKSTGLVFKVQSRGSSKLEPSADGSWFPADLSVDHVEYWTTQLSMPVALIISDVTVGASYWYTPQTDRGLRQRLADAKAAVPAQQTLTVRVRRAHDLKTSQAEFVRALQDAELAQAVLGIRRRGTWQFVESVRGSVGVAESFEALHSKTEALRIDQMDELQRRGAWEDVTSHANAILADPASTTYAKVASVLSLETASLVKFRATHDPHDRIVRGMARTAAALRDISRRGPRDLRAFALFYKHTSRLADAAYADFGSFLNRKVLVSNAEVLPLPTAIAASRRAGRRLQRSYAHCLRSIEALLRSNAMRLVPQAVARMIQSFTPASLRLRMDGFAATADAYRDQLREITKFAVEIAARHGQSDMVGGLVGMCVLLRDPEETEQATGSMVWAENVINGAPISDVDKRSALDHIREVESSHQKAVAAYDPGELDLAAEAQIYIEMAGSFGIDAEHGHDEPAELVRLGLKDLNPERVLRFCEHLFVSYGQQHALSVQLQMPSSAEKRLRCLLHGWHIGSMSLDVLGNAARTDLCVGCKDGKPMPDDWKWSRPWQQEMDRRVAESRRLGGRPT